MTTRWEIDLTPVCPNTLWAVVKDGVDISNQIRGIVIRSYVGEPTTVEVEFVNVDLSGTVEEEVTQ